MQPKDTMIQTSIRLSESIIMQLRARAKHRGISYQQLIRLLLADHIDSPVIVK